MFKDGIELNKNSWHARLMNYIWSVKHTSFSHLCPYFWITILNLIIVIPVFIVRYPFKMISRFIQYLINSYDTRNRKELNRIMNDLDYENILRNMSFKKLKSLRENAYSDLTSNDKYNKFMRIFWERYDNQNKEIEDKKKIVRINKFAEPVSKVFMYILAAGLAFLFIWSSYIVIIASIKLFDVSIFLSALGIVVILLNIYNLLRLAKNVFDLKNDPAEHFSKPFIYIWSLIKTVFSKACPPIDWK